MAISKLTLCALLFGMALSWNGHTHIMVARVAYDKLASSYPNVLAQANNLLNELKVSTPTLVPKEDMYPFVECTTLADDMKYNGWSWQSDWHYVDTPWLDEGGSMSDYPKYTGINPTTNITQVLTDLTNWLKDTGDYKSSKTYTTITGHYNAADSKSIALRLLIHFMGDVHQPLHAMNKLDPEFPTGDAGGNAFPLTYHYDVDELHALWDTVIYENHDSTKLPFTADTWSSFGTATTKIASKYSFTSSDTNQVNFYDIGKESFALGTKYAYDGVTMNAVVPPEYQATTLPIAERQLTLGGLRLAHLMTTIFPNTPVVKQEVDFKGLLTSSVETIQGQIEQVNVQEHLESVNNIQEQLNSVNIQERINQANLQEVAAQAQSEAVALHAEVKNTINNLVKNLDLPKFLF